MMDSAVKLWMNGFPVNHYLSFYSDRRINPKAKFRFSLPLDLTCQWNLEAFADHCRYGHALRLMSAPQAPIRKEAVVLEDIRMLFQNSQHDASRSVELFLAQNWSTLTEGTVSVLSGGAKQFLRDCLGVDVPTDLALLGRVQQTIANYRKRVDAPDVFKKIFD